MTRTILICSRCNHHAIYPVRTIGPQAVWAIIRRAVSGYFDAYENSETPRLWTKDDDGSDGQDDRMRAPAAGETLEALQGAVTA